MKNVIRDASNKNFDNPSLVWEWTKFKIREFSMAYVVKRNREQKAPVNSLEKRLQLLAESMIYLTQQTL